MIEKVNYISLLDSIPRNEYLITGGSWLSVMNIRTNTDIDIVMSKTLSETFDKYLGNEDIISSVSKYIDKSPKHARKLVAIAGAKNNDDLIKRFSVSIDGYNFVLFNIYRQYKKPRKRDQDKKDMRAIKEFFKSGKHLKPEYRELF